MNNIKIPEFQTSSLCEKCKGSCCKHMACHFSPSDFEELTFEHLSEKIDEGWISIDWWESDEPQYYLRVRHVNAPIVDPSWGGTCVLLTDTGCPLPFEKRPLGARALEPTPNGCVVHYSKYDCKNDWLKYDDILRKLVTKYEK